MICPEHIRFFSLRRYIWYTLLTVSNASESNRTRKHSSLSPLTVALTNAAILFHLILNTNRLLTVGITLNNNTIRIVFIHRFYNDTVRIILSTLTISDLTCTESEPSSTISQSESCNTVRLKHLATIRSSIHTTKTQRSSKNVI